MMPSVAAFPGKARWLPALSCLLLLVTAGCTMAVHSAVRDQSGSPLPNAVVYATPKDRAGAPPRGNPKAAMIVENFAFEPPVLPVRVGTGVTFLSRDDVRHLVYSISPAKNFERVADRRSPSAEVVFDRPGEVVLGCAVHDRAVGHILVLGTPYFATTGADGRAELARLPRGEYEVRVWHPEMRAPSPPARPRVAGPSGREASVGFTVTVRGGRLPDPVPPPVAPKGQ